MGEGLRELGAGNMGSSRESGSWCRSRMAQARRRGEAAAGAAWGWRLRMGAAGSSDGMGYRVQGRGARWASRSRLAAWWACGWHGAAAAGAVAAPTRAGAGCGGSRRWSRSAQPRRLGEQAVRTWDGVRLVCERQGERREVRRAAAGVCLWPLAKLPAPPARSGSCCNGISSGT